MVSSLVAFDLLWLSEDHNTAHILLCGCYLFLGLSDCLSADTLVLMTHCLGLSSLSCSLAVCLFSNNGLGAVGSLALSPPLACGHQGWSWGSESSPLPSGQWGTDQVDFKRIVVLRMLGRHAGPEPFPVGSEDMGLTENVAHWINPHSLSSLLPGGLLTCSLYS